MRPTASIRPTGATLVIGAMIGAVAVAGCGAGQITQTSEQVAAVQGASADAGPIAVRDVVIEYAEAEGGETADVYAEGDDAPLRMTIVNTGATPDRLVSASSPAAGSVEISGDTEIGGDQSVVIEGLPEAPPAPPAPTLAPSGTAAPGASTTSAPAAGPTPTVAPTGPPSPRAENSVGPTPGVGGFDPAGPGQGTVEDPAAIDKGTQVVLVGLTEDVRSGLTYPLTLTFEQAGAITVNVPVALSTAERETEH